ncbi:50S ribosomal protein L14e [Candidatus Woesearchaeota archaeon]|nr:MAG: 50S ribosomal protein L14e [Candidatus Woesearchaeota archaeon]
MAVIEVGRVCLKIAGRDSNKRCVIVDVLNNNYVLIDGETRRKKCNVKHIEPTSKVIKISKGASHAEVVREFKKLGIEIKEKVKKEKKPEKSLQKQTKKEEKKEEKKKEKEEKKLEDAKKVGKV